MDVSTDSFWLELMLWHELERTGVRSGLRELHENLSFAKAKGCYLNWVKKLGALGWIERFSELAILFC